MKKVKSGFQLTKFSYRKHGALVVILNWFKNIKEQQYFYPYDYSYLMKLKLLCSKELLIKNFKINKKLKIKYLENFSNFTYNLGIHDTLKYFTKEKLKGSLGFHSREI